MIQMVRMWSAIFSDEFEIAICKSMVVILTFRKRNGVFGFTLKDLKVNYMTEWNIDQFLSKLKEFDALREEDDIRLGEVDRIRPVNAEDWPSRLSAPIRKALVNSGIDRPYQHQAEAVNLALDGADVVMESPTASGKTLAFTAPMLHVLKENPGSHAMMIYPMKALAFDQREQIRRICQPLGIESWPYDGDTAEDHKAVIRQNPPPILLTNPEYLNMSFLGNRESWDRHSQGAKLLRNLRFVVIDEMHEYRGFFGGNMALLLRRFFLHLTRIGACPQVFLSTATCANPQEHAESLTGRQVELVSARNVLRPQRSFVFVNPSIRDYRFWEILRLRVENAALAALTEGFQVLVFCPTKRFLEQAFRNTRRRAEESGFDSSTVTAFHADLRPDFRQEIQEKIKAGEVRIVFTTNALEIGLDVGGLDGVILAGFPPSIMSAWQQMGRAGRAWDKDAFVLFYAMNDPIDQFFVNNLDAFLNKPFDELVVDPGNEELIERHIPSLMEEAGGIIAPAEEPILGKAFFDSACTNQGEVPKGYKPQQRLNLRGGVGQSFAIKRGNEELGQISAMRRFKEAYIGAVFPFFGQKYHVKAHEERAIMLEDCEQHLKTEPSFFANPSVSDIFEGNGYHGVRLYYGSLNIGMNFTGYRLADERTDETIRTGGDYDSLYLNNLHSFWLEIPPGPDTFDGIGAVEHMFRVGTMFVVPCDRFDTSTLSRSSGDTVAYCYENYPGGIGIARRLFARWDVVLAKGLDVARSCRCSTGCQNCIEPAKSWDMSNGNINKVKGIQLGEHLLELAHQGPDEEFRNGLMRPI